MKEILELCEKQECVFQNLESHPQHGWIARVSYKGIWGAGEDAGSPALAVVDAIRCAIHLQRTYHERPQLVDLKDIDL